ncbi:hypothetical protein D3C72_199510 [compost metagenome]
MFGISPLGWLHTLGSLPAIPLAIYMLVRYGKITPRNTAGIAYFIFMLIGASTIFLFAKQPVSYGIALATIFFLLTGYGIGRVTALGRAAAYIETICLSITVFLLMVPSVSETLRRVPDGHPFVTDPKSPLLLGALAALFIILIVGLSVQILSLRKRNKAGV